ncbi:MAG TPA: Gfo/Idh/MocA family oxidoreductase [Verrucomicrobiales bacterium]|nr:Gfo/Idh/MocA family oxidoreductase [Verrucomicrobiales bacterium]
MNELRVGVAGVGAIGQNHARVLAELEGVKLVGIFDLDAERAAEAAKRFGTRVFASLEDLAGAVDAATVATPTVTHAAVGTMLLERGRHVLIEKPIASSVAEAEALLTCAHNHGCVLQVGHIERFNPVLEGLEELLGTPRFIEAHRLSPFPRRSTDIGVVLDLMIHDLEVILYLVRSDVDQIDAVGVPVLTGSEDIANARIRFVGGCVANVTASRVSPERLRKIRIFQEDCYLSLDYQEQNGRLYRKENGQIVPSEIAVRKDEPLKLELRSFVECARQGSRPRVSGQEGMKALELALEITRGIRTGAGWPGTSTLA